MLFRTGWLVDWQCTESEDSCKTQLVLLPWMFGRVLKRLSEPYVTVVWRCNWPRTNERVFLIVECVGDPSLSRTRDSYDGEEEAVFT